ncbi:hypothetical protein PQS31_01920 [Luteimonas sp BLCC-B24]|uniref:hypothetical protein n=1 Tax=Luteimonas sp. BLCC-B24 TaxID=3025317 RepID=UPI00234CD621|nr:hypothetical protein [Luteimonas sp. BLCC-B24]MDC7805587.1 hypothetical protein [Luteimonas sp. BLCC-B24]
MSAAPVPPDADPAWLHALRNAVNAATVAVAAARSALESDDPGRAGFFLEESAGACRRAAQLLHARPERHVNAAPERG